MTGRTVETRDTLRLVAIEIIRGTLTGLFSCFIERIKEGVLQGAAGDPERTAAPAPCTLSPVRRLAALEVGQASIEPPLCKAEGIRPPVVVHRVAAHVHHRIDRGGTADDLATG